MHDARVLTILISQPKEGLVYLPAWGRGGPVKETGERDETDELGMLMCRGHKTVVKFFSSEVADLEPVLALLLRCDAEVSPDDMSVANTHPLSDIGQERF